MMILRKSNQFSTRAFRLSFLLSFLLGVLTCFSQSNVYTISGYIYDNASYETLIGATIFHSKSQLGTISNEYGFYSISLPEGNHEISFSHLGYEAEAVIFELSRNVTMNINLNQRVEYLDEVVVSDEKIKRVEHVSSAEMSVIDVKVETIQKIPVLFGEVDVIKAVQLLPGVQTVAEGSSGFYVRGGNLDQNLILLDEAPVYNATHLGGLFSTFNPDAIKDVKVYKGGFPTNYGGRLSSVVDIRMKEGNRKHFTAKGGIGTAMSRLTLETPLGESGSFLIAGRRTYLDAVFKAIEGLSKSQDEETDDFTMYFYDLNVKGNYRIGKNDQVFLSGYFGRDVNGFESREDNAYIGFQWGNSTSTIRWNHLYSPKLFSNLIFYYSQYDYNLGFNQDRIEFNWNSRLKEYGIKYDFTYYLNPQNILKFGSQSVLHKISPGQIEVYDDKLLTSDLNIQHNQSIANAVYVNNDWDISDKLKLSAGLRLAGLFNLGPQEVLALNNDYEITDTTRYGRGIYHSTWNLEPRINLRYLLSSNSSLKASYTRASQYIHLASNGNFSSPFDVWLTSSPNIEPQLADQWTLGFYANLFKNELSISGEFFFKKFRNAIDFKDHAELLFNENLENEIRTGKGRAYGFEFLLKKHLGKFTGWLGYTYSRARRQINGINDNNWYNAKYDVPHNLTTVILYDYSKTVSVGANFTYTTGGAVTLPVGGYDFYGTRVPLYSERNDARLPDYLRLDLSITLRNESNDYKKFRTEWVFGVYNLSGRKNAFAIAFNEDANNPGVQIAEKISLFSWVPSITFNFIY